MARWRNFALWGIGAMCAATLIGLVAKIFLITPTEAQAPPPLVLAKTGVFYAGGHYDQNQPDQHFVAQMYVEYQIPAEQKHRFPIVLIHGGGQTGSGWQSTPDGRP